MSPKVVEDATAEFNLRVQIVSPPPDQFLNSKFGTNDARGSHLDPGGHTGGTELPKPRRPPLRLVLLQRAAVSPFACSDTLRARRFYIARLFSPDADCLASRPIS